MTIIRVGCTCLLVALAVAASGCDNSGSSTVTNPSQTTSTEVLTGTVAVPAGGVLQSSFNTFVVGQGGGPVSVTLTSAVETLPGGTLLTTVTMGLGIGTPSGSTCALMANSSTVAQSGANPQLSGSLAAGTFCVLVSDVTNQLGPVAYALAVAHP